MGILRSIVDKTIESRNLKLIYLGSDCREAERNTTALAYDYTLRRSLAENRINCVIDVGANIGQFAMRIRDCGYTGHIASIEPFKQCFQELQQAMASDPGWTGFNYAAGASRGRSDLHVMPKSVFNSFCEPDPESIARLGVDGRPLETQSTEIYPLDDVWNELTNGVADARTFLKIDTQGFDHAVLAGAARSLPKVVLLQVELAVQELYHGVRDWKDMLSDMRAAGWGIAGLFPAAQAGNDGTVMEFDCLLQRTTGGPR